MICLMWVAICCGSEESKDWGLRHSLPGPSLWKEPTRVRVFPTAMAMRVPMEPGGELVGVGDGSGDGFWVMGKGMRLMG